MISYISRNLNKNTFFTKKSNIKQKYFFGAAALFFKKKGAKN
jgi:hypothetical protein